MLLNSKKIAFKKREIALFAIFELFRAKSPKTPIFKQASYLPKLYRVS